MHLSACATKLFKEVLVAWVAAPPLHSLRRNRSILFHWRCCCTLILHQNEAAAPLFLPSNTNVISLTAAVMVISHLDDGCVSPLTVSVKKVTPQRGWGSSRMLYHLISWNQWKRSGITVQGVSIFIRAVPRQFRHRFAFYYLNPYRAHDTFQITHPTDKKTVHRFVYWFG